METDTAGGGPEQAAPAGSKNPVTLLREARAEELVRLGRDRLGAMLEVVADIAEDPEAPPGVRLTAANSFLDRPNKENSRAFMCVNTTTRFHCRTMDYWNQVEPWTCAKSISGSR